MKKYFLFGILVLLLLTACSQTKSFQKNIQVQELDQILLANLKSALTNSPSTYAGSYEMTNYVRTWASFGSGSTNIDEKSIIAINVENNEVFQFTNRYVFSNGFSDLNKNYIEEYNKEQGELCTSNTIQSSSCHLSEEPQPPQLGGTLQGCQISVDGGHYDCVCNGVKKSIDVTENIAPDFPCPYDVDTAGKELWDEFNIIYYPESKTGFCFFATKDSSLAVKCQNKNVISLIPDISSAAEQPMNVICRYRKYNYACGCNFNPLPTTKTCKSEKPQNLDITMKSDALSFLNTIQLETLESSDDAVFGKCYFGKYANMLQTFCFKENGALSYSRYGTNSSTESSSSINIKTIKTIR